MIYSEKSLKMLGLSLLPMSHGVRIHPFKGRPPTTFDEKEHIRDFIGFN